MYRLLLVDDEEWVVESLKGSIDWNKYGFEVIGQAYNGFEACEQIQQLIPSVVFADIRMPGMTGLELMKKTSEFLPDTKFIIISGYAEFAYAQKALNDGAIGYCLKPFNELEIINLLSKVKKMLDTSRSLLEPKFFDLIHSSYNCTYKQMNDILLELGLKWNHNMDIIVVIVIGKDEITLPAGLKYLKLKMGTHKSAYLVECANSMSIKEYLIDKATNEILGIGIAKALKDISNIKEAFDEAEIAAYNFFITGQKGVCEIPALCKDDIRNVLRCLYDSTYRMDYISVKNNFKTLEELFKTHSYNIKHAFYLYNMVMTFLCNVEIEPYENYICDCEQLINNFENVFDMITYLRELVIREISPKSENINKEIENENIKLILQYVDDNFCNDIFIQDLSRKFFMNSSYISQLFKKEMGVNFSEYLTRRRINYACDLMRESCLSMQEIGEKVGYNDYFYFSKVFKRVTGKTPTLYRKE